MELTFEQIDEVYDIISSKGWEEKCNNSHQNILDLSLDLFSKIRNNDEFLMLKIFLKSFFWCTDYYPYASILSDHISKTFKGEKVVLVPVNDDMGKIKSGHGFAYDVMCFLKDEEFESCLIRESLESIKDIITDYSIIAIDDFIGSGSQFRKFSRSVIDNFQVNSSDIYLYSIVTMNSAKKRIENHCYDFVSCEVFNRSISDNIEKFFASDPIQNYNNFEKLIDIGRNFRRGYLKSESLVSMKRTPNNTLPIFGVNNLLMAKNGQRYFRGSKVMQINLQNEIIKAIATEGSVSQLEEQGYTSAQIAICVRNMFNAGLLLRKDSRFIIAPGVQIPQDHINKSQGLEILSEYSIEKMDKNSEYEIRHRTFTQILERVRPSSVAAG